MTTNLAIAIVGMAGRFPGAPDINAFWKNLCEGNETITFFSEEELLKAGVQSALLASPFYIKAKGVISQPEYFDADFFGISATEAQILDPQHRLFLECVWEALENAGYISEVQAGRVGVYAGINSLNTYYQHYLAWHHELKRKIGDYQIAINNMPDSLSTRVSYKLNFTGPSCTVQTACSTSLVAVCMACQSLLDYQCDMAIAGGVSM